MQRTTLMLALALAAGATFPLQAADTARTLTQQELAQVITWRRDIHQHPELSNRETRTAALVAAQLRKLGLEVHTGIAHTGVVALLQGGQPGRGWPCARTWMRCRSPSRWHCRLPRRHTARIAARRLA